MPRREPRLLRHLRARLKARGYTSVAVVLERDGRDWRCVVYRGLARTAHGYGHSARRATAIRQAFTGGLFHD